jgi:hypothetical protein
VALGAFLSYSIYCPDATSILHHRNPCAKMGYDTTPISFKAKHDRLGIRLPNRNATLDNHSASSWFHPYRADNPQGRDGNAGPSEIH